MKKMKQKWEHSNNIWIFNVNFHRPNVTKYWIARIQLWSSKFRRISLDHRRPICINIYIHYENITAILKTQIYLLVHVWWYKVILCHQLCPHCLVHTYMRCLLWTITRLKVALSSCFDVLLGIIHRHCICILYKKNKFSVIYKYIKPYKNI